MTTQNVKAGERRRMRKKRRSKVYYLIIITAVFIFLINIFLIKFNKKSENSGIKENVMKEEAVKEDAIEEEKSKKKDEWVDLDLKYIGSAKTKSNTWDTNEYGDYNKFEDGNLVYYIGRYGIFISLDSYMKNNKRLDEIYDEDFILEEKEGKEYVYMYGRKMKWLQYNPGRESMSGGYANRAGLDWEMEFAENTLFFYEHDSIEDGGLAEMLMEVFVDEENGKVYWADEEKRVYLE